MTNARPGVTVRRVKWFRRARRLVERHPFASDAAIAIALAAFVLSDVLGSGDYFTASKAIYVPAALLMTLPLAWRRKAPLPVLAIVMGALVFESLAVGSAPTPDSQLVGWLLAIYTVAAHCDRVAALAGGAIALTAGLIWMGIGDFLFPVVVFGGAWLAGRLVRQRDVHAQVAEERSAALDREREANVRAASAEERARIARELHDVLSHSVSVMVVQAGAERMALGSGKPVTARGAGGDREDRPAGAHGDEALAGDAARLRRAARPCAPADAGRARRARGAGARGGVPVELHVEGSQVALPPGVAVSAYRIVQEALTNVLKHAGPAHARVIVRYSSRELELEIADDGQGPREADDAGHGLVGHA